MDGYYMLSSLFILAVIMLPFYIRFERKAFVSREIVLVAVLAAIAAVSRVPFSILPSVQPTSFVIIVSAIVFGSETGFMIGATAAIVSNIFLGQGPWTPWQMFSWGMIGFIAGLLRNTFFMKKLWGRLLYGVIVGFLFGLGFDTATQIAVLATSATAANAGVPWYATMAFPLLFTAGMCLMDTVDGFFMSTTYNWVFSSPYRKVYYNLTITGISILAAGFIGFIDLVQAFSAMFDWHNVLTRWVAALDFNKMGLILVMMFVVTWIIAITFWHIFKLADKEDVGIITENRGK